MSEPSVRGRQSKAAAAKHQAARKKRKNAKSNASKLRAKHAKKALDQYHATLPKVSEDDLLNFQFAHFGDDTKPDNWFVAKQAAINFELDDELGYYDDGVKRTLTDEQIAVFRRKELWQMKHEQEEEQKATRETAANQNGGRPARAVSPVSDVSSLEDELLAYASVKPLEPGSNEYKQRQASQSGRSEVASNPAASWKGRPLQESIPYDQRNKRKWEGYINDEDPLEGSLTHRRVAREMDNQRDESIEMDY